MSSSHHWHVLLSAFFGVILLLVLVARFKVSAFVALTLVSLGVGLASGLPPGKVVSAFTEGVGAVLSTIAVIIALGTVLGRLLADSGGAEVLSERILGAFGRPKLNWAILLIGFLVGLPVFFSVGLVLLVPILFVLAARIQAPVPMLAIPLLAGLSASHSLVPPHPGPIAATQLVGVDVGLAVLYSMLIGLPAAALAAVLVGKLFINESVNSRPRKQIVSASGPAVRRARPGFFVTLFTILLPIILMMMASLADVALGSENRIRPWLTFVGHPVVALLIAAVFAFCSLGIGCGYSLAEIRDSCESCLQPLASIFLVVGCGGGFSKVLLASGAGESVAQLAGQWNIPVIVISWVLAGLFRVATGSATVAITTAAGVLAPALKQIGNHDAVLAVVAMGAGSMILSHVNDGGFWLVKGYLDLTVEETFRIWTTLVTAISVLAFLFVLILHYF